MKVIKAIAISLSISCLIAIPTVHAQTSLTTEKQAVIAQSCVQAQTILQRVQHNDAATRVNRGQGYETLISRLMTPLNSRATSLGYNTSASLLVETTKRYQQALDKFKNNYRNYDNTITNTLRVKCQKDPVKFYEYIEQARKQRQALTDDVTTLANIISEYRDNVTKLRAEVQ